MGHGTHCAGTLGSSTYGVAKNVSQVAVKTIDQYGAVILSNALSGCEWVYNDFEQKMIDNGGVRPKAVASMSWGFPITL